MKKILFITIVIGVCILAGIGYTYRGEVRDIIFAFQQPAVPKPMTKDEARQVLQDAGIIPAPATTSDQAVRKESMPPTLPDQINLDVPFTPQAPFAVWDVFHEDACEEASALMVGHFWKNQPITSPADADTELLAIGKLEDKIFGYNKDTNAEQTARFMQEFYSFKNVVVKYDITINDIVAEVGQGFPVIVPLYGRNLNPYFSGGGPLYHMLVIKGYTKGGQFITNDPGTRRGKDYVYDQKYIFGRIHDWNGGDVLNGRKAIIVARP